MKDQTCEERVDANLRREIDALQTLWNLYLEDDEDYGNIYEYGLSFDYVTPNTFNNQPQGYFRYQLSYGGPSDEFRFYTGPELEPYRIEYQFLDWWDGAFRQLGGTDLELLQEIFQWFKDGGTVQCVFEQAQK